MNGDGASMERCRKGLGFRGWGLVKLRLSCKFSFWSPLHAISNDCVWSPFVERARVRNKAGLTFRLTCASLLAKIL